MKQRGGSLGRPRLGRDELHTFFHLPCACGFHVPHVGLPAWAAHPVHLTDGCNLRCSTPTRVCRSRGVWDAQWMPVVALQRSSSPRDPHLPSSSEAAPERRSSPSTDDRGLCARQCVHMRSFAFTVESFDASGLVLDISSTPSPLTASVLGSSASAVPGLSEGATGWGMSARPHVATMSLACYNFLQRWHVRSSIQGSRRKQLEETPRVYLSFLPGVLSVAPAYISTSMVPVHSFCRQVRKG